MRFVRRGLLFGLALAAGCAAAAGGLRDGDTVTPALAHAPIWIAGRPNLLQVRLQAVARDGADVRQLDFTGIPGGDNPTATVTFYRGDTALSPLAVTLDHRC